MQKVHEKWKRQDPETYARKQATQQGKKRPEHAAQVRDGRRYTPDFLVSEWQCYIEIKGHRKFSSTTQAQQDGYNVILLRGERAIRNFQHAHEILT